MNDDPTTWQALADGEGEPTPPSPAWRRMDGVPGWVRDSTCDICAQPVLVDHGTDRLHPHRYPDGDVCEGSGLRSLDEHADESIATVNGGLPTLGKNR